MRVCAAIIVLIWLCLWGQAFLDHSQIWAFFALLWTAIMGSGLIVVASAKLCQFRYGGTGGGWGTASGAV